MWLKLRRGIQWWHEYSGLECGFDELLEQAGVNVQVWCEWSQSGMKQKSEI